MHHRTVRDVLTMTMDDYTDSLLRAGLRPVFDEWLRREGISRLGCFELTITGEGPLHLRCYSRDSEGAYFRRPDAPDGVRFSTEHLQTEVIEFTVSTPPPPEVVRYLLTVRNE